MPEPMIQVPVSLIEHVTTFLDGMGMTPILAAKLRATLSQPTPTAEPDWPKQTTQPGVTEEESMRRIDRSVGKLPSIADMAPKED